MYVNPELEPEYRNEVRSSKAQNLKLAILAFEFGTDINFLSTTSAFYE